MNHQQQLFPFIDLPMTSLKKLPEYKNQKELLSSIYLLEPKLLPQHTIYFIQYQQFITKQLNRKYLERDNRLQNKVSIILELIKEDYPEPTLMHSVKKYAFIHLLTHLIAKSGHSQRKKIADLLHKQTMELVNQEIPIIVQQKKQETNKSKREGSLDRLFNKIRSISTPKRSSQREKSMTKLEKGEEKGALKEFMLKVMNPLASYLLKLTQDIEIYAYILSKGDIQHNIAVKWKIFNYLQTLGKVIMQLNKIAKYYRDEMLGCWILLNYVMSLDIAIYYDMLITSISSRCNQWKETIAMTIKFTKINKRKGAEIQTLLQDQKLLELKDQINTLMEIKEKLFYLYYNVQTQRWSHLMEAPFKTGERNIKMQPIEYILDIYENHNIQQHKKQNYPREANSLNLSGYLKKKSKSEVTIEAKSVMLSSRKDSIKQQKNQDEVIKTTSTIASSNRNPTRQNNLMQNSRAKP